MARIATFLLVLGAVTSGAILVLGLRSAIWDATFLIGIGAALLGLVFNGLPLGRSRKRMSRRDYAQAFEGAGNPLR